MKIRNNRYKELLAFGCTLLLIILWSYAGIAKLSTYHRFVEQMQLVPIGLLNWLAPTLAWLVPVLELALVVLLWREDTRYLGWCMSFGLLLLFVCYILGLLLSGIDLPCTCGGILSGLSWKQHLGFNLVFMSLSALPIYLLKNRNDISGRYI